MNRKLRATAALLALIMLSGCADDTHSSGTLPEPPASAVSTAGQDEAPPGHAGSAETQDAPAQEHSAETEQAQTEHASAEAQASSGDVTHEPDDVTDEESGEAAPPVTTASTQAYTEPVTTPPATTAQTTTTAASMPPEPVKVVIPEVKVPLSPGKDTASNDKALVDYSNSSEGYISVCWNETGKRVKLRITSGDKVYDHDVAGGGATEYFPLSCGSGGYKVQLYEQTEGDKYAKSLETEFTVKLRSDTVPFTYPNKYVRFSQSSAVVEKAAELCAGRTDEIDKLAAVFGWITDNVTYDKQLAATVKSGYVPDPDSVLKKKTGICYDYASLLAAMTRSQGIPTRLVVGYAADSIYHAWNEVWTDETGWITPELLLSRKGYNIVDSTFYAGSSDKEKIAAYIQNSANYAALYYY